MGSLPPHDPAIDLHPSFPSPNSSHLDRSHFHVLLCDKDPDSTSHAMSLLQQCSYQVTCVKSAGQVVEVLRSCSYEVDLILSEVELPKEKGLKMLRHIVRKQHLHRIPVVIMSERDEMALIVKCLKLGAVDYLLKPLRSNELLNLWTHTWRRRRMLGLSEKHTTNGKLRIPFDLIVSETSESNNTNGTNPFSEDISNNDACAQLVPSGGENPQLELSLRISLEATSAIPASKQSPGMTMHASDHLRFTTPVMSCPKKTELKIAQSSAFFSYVRSNAVVNNPHQPRVQSETTENHLLQEVIPRSRSSDVQMAAHVGPAGPARESEVPPKDVAPSCISANLRFMNDGALQDPLVTPPNVQPLAPFDSRNMSSAPGYATATATASPFLPQLAQIRHPSIPSQETISVNVVTGIPIVQGLNLVQGPPSAYPFSYCTHATHMSASQMGSFHSWRPSEVATMSAHKLSRSERREAALDKFRRKRKDRCYDKKIRYVSRKRLAEQRPRIRGQFVKRDDNKDNNSNGGFEEEDDDDEDYEEQCFFEELNAGSSPESVAEDA